MTYHRLILLAGTLGSTLTMIAPAATAGPVFVTGERQEVLFRQVQYGDLNLMAPDDQRQLRTRVGSAISSLCLEATSFERSPRSGIFVMQCRQSTWNQARPQISKAIAGTNSMAALGYPAAAAVVISLRLQPR